MEWRKHLLIFLIFLTIGSVVILSLVPPVTKDALTHHLSVPKLYLKHGGIYQIPFMPYSYYPMNLELLYIIPLYFNNDIIPKFLHMTFALLTAWLLFSHLRKRLSFSYAAFGALFFLSTPIIIKLSITVYVDLGLIFFSTVSLLWLIRWRENNFPIKSLLVSAVFCGLAMGTKYNGLVTFLLLTLFVPFLYATDREGYGGLKKLVSFTGIFLVTALLVFSPWLIRNYIWTGNPIYPLYDNWFNPGRHVVPNTVGVFKYRALLYNEKWWEILLLPIRVFFQGQDGNPQLFDGKLNPLLMVFPIFAFFPSRTNGEQERIEKKTLLLFSVFYFLFALFSSSLRIRYISPIIPPLVLLSTYGIRNVFEFSTRFHSIRIGRLSAWVFSCLIILSISFNALYVMDQFRTVHPISYLKGEISRSKYIEKYRPEYPAMEYINKNLGPDAKLLFIFMGNRGYYCDKPYVFDMIGSKSMFSDLCNKTRDPRKVWEGLRKDGITHLLVNVGIFRKWVKKAYKIRERKVLTIFFRDYTRIIYSKNGYLLFLLKHDLPGGQNKAT